jgi:hypothetical protein
MLNLRVAEHVRYRTQEHGGVVILDPVGGEWLALNSTAGDLWRAWDSGIGFECGVCKVADSYPEVSAETIRDDALQLAEELIARGLVEAAPLGTVHDPHAKWQAPSASPGNAAMMAEPPFGDGARALGFLLTVQALTCLVAACLVIRFFPFRTSLAMVRRARRHWCRPLPPTNSVALVAAVGWAVRRYPGRAACLEQSFAAVLLAAVRRRSLDWCLGAAADPYRFHAWVEAAGRPMRIPGDPQSAAGFIRLLTA